MRVDVVEGVVLKYRPEELKDEEVRALVLMMITRMKL